MGDASQAESSLAASEGVQQDERKDKSWLWRQLTEKESECSKLERALSSAQAEWNAERSRLRRELAALGAQLQAQAAQLQQAEGESTKLRKELAGALGLSDEEPEPPRCRVRQSDSPATAVSGACGSDTAEVEAAAVCSDREALAEETSKAAVVAEPPEAQDDRQLLQDDVKQVPAVPAVWLRRLRRRAGFERKRAKFALFRLRAVRRSCSPGEMPWRSGPTPWQRQSKQSLMPWTLLRELKLPSRAFQKRIQQLMSYLLAS
eukprot:TRINITY_DN30863_c0_g1_i1.p1 TRINITY_DN30863_c0_g1~~TRINITY_DN30863_c0_g1_i1.p1  ORF type:complete len:262 (+),score=81.97 TRINITY_DN30863_c0_g1_i1:82-867(+)